jgi:hypothetical protein
VFSPVVYKVAGAELVNPSKPLDWSGVDNFPFRLTDPDEIVDGIPKSDLERERAFYSRHALILRVKWAVSFPTDME